MLLGTRDPRLQHPVQAQCKCTQARPAFLLAAITINATNKAVMDQPESEKKVHTGKDKAGSPSRSRSASYSPLPPKSPPQQSPSRSSLPLKRQASRSRSRSRSRDWSRSPSRSRSRSPSSESRDKRRDRRNSRESTEAYSVQVRGLTRVVTDSHLEHVFTFYGAISDIIMPTFRISELP